MSSINKVNIYIPFREDEIEQRVNVFNSLRDFYEKNNFNVVVVDSGSEIFNIPESKNIALDYGDEVTCIINADTLISPIFLHKAIKYSKENKCIVKPYTRYFIIDSLDDQIKYLLEDDVLSSFNYNFVKNYYPGAAWVIYNDSSVQKFNANILNSNSNNIEYLIRSSMYSKTLFIESDCYSINHSKKMITGGHDIKIDNLINFLNDDIINIYKNNCSQENKLCTDEILEIIEQA